MVWVDVSQSKRFRPDKVEKVNLFETKRMFYDISLPRRSPLYRQGESFDLQGNPYGDPDDSMIQGLLG